MRNFQYELERYTERTGQNINWLKGLLYFFIPLILLLHVVVINMFFLGMEPHAILYGLYIYTALTLLTGIAAIVLVRVFSHIAYYLLLGFSMLNAMRCVAAICGLLLIIVTAHRPPDNELRHPIIAFVIALVLSFSLFIILAEAFECSLHLANYFYVKKRKAFFKA